MNNQITNQRAVALCEDMCRIESANDQPSSVLAAMEKGYSDLIVSHRELTNFLGLLYDRYDENERWHVSDEREFFSLTKQVLVKARKVQSLNSATKVQ